jgi:hypothetical protein
MVPVFVGVEERGNGAIADASYRVQEGLGPPLREAGIDERHGARPHQEGRVVETPLAGWLQVGVDALAHLLNPGGRCQLVGGASLAHGDSLSSNTWGEIKSTASGASLVQAWVAHGGSRGGSP